MAHCDEHSNEDSTNFALKSSRERALLLHALALGAICVLSGCATTIVPPHWVADPVEVFVLDHGRTSSLIVPKSDGRMLRYAYGDWNYYALGRNDVFHGLAALLWPTQGALGRAEMGAPVTASTRLQVNLLESIHPVQVDRAHVEAFEQRMEALYESRLNTEVENRSVSLSFVHHPRRYTYFWNSNHAVASWLRELGCATRGAAFHASWRVAVVN